MSDTSLDRRYQWAPPQRPDWVQRINDEGSWMNISGVVPLDEDSLLKSAMRATGLSDFGADDWYEPFKVLVRSLDEEATLNLVGRIQIRSELLQLLGARLQIEDTYKRHPEIHDEEIKQPYIIIGQGRSGTSYLVNLLAADPDAGSLKTWETIFPCPPPEKATYLNDPRIERAHKSITFQSRVTPTYAAMHEYAGNLPQECCLLLAMNFVCLDWFNSFGQISSYNAYAANIDMEQTYRYHQKVLKLLQWKNPRKHWVLKYVGHQDFFPTVLKVYPDACFIWPHRDPVKALASMVDVIGTVQWARTDHPFKDDSWNWLVTPEATARRMNEVIDILEAGVVPKAQLCNLLYRDLVAKPIATVENIYAHFRRPFDLDSRRAIEQYVTENPRTARPPHKIHMGTPEMIARERKAYRRYQEYFNVPDDAE